MSSVYGESVFRRFPRWSGVVEKGWKTNFLGVRIRDTFLRRQVMPPGQFLVAEYPPIDEGYFEWLDLLESVCSARGSFAMVELGAGWGRWIVNGAAAARQLGLPFRLVAVEAEPTHFEWLCRHVSDNAIAKEDVTLYEAAIAARDGETGFVIGAPSRWWGQKALPLGSPLPPVPPAVHEKAEREQAPLDMITVNAVSLTTVLEPLGLVDLVDADIQGAEGEVFEAAAQAVDENVRRVHIETHTTGAEDTLRTVFSELGWRCLYDYPFRTASETPCGPIYFQGGLQTWINPRLE